MTNKNLDRIRTMTRRCIAKMFDGKTQSDEQASRENMDDYTALCEAVCAMEKQTPRKPKRLPKPKYSRCPSCMAILSQEMPHCDNCGQALDWSSKSASADGQIPQDCICNNKSDQHHNKVGVSDTPSRAELE